jgi:hypothetical protein
VKLKASDWNCSGGDAFVDALMEHLKAQANDEVEINLTPDGIEVIKGGSVVEYLGAAKQAVLDLLLAHTAPVAQVEDPYSHTGVAYVVIGIDPCSPVIREVPAGTSDSHATLVDAKEAARQLIQSALAKASTSLAELRQVGIERIAYISL